MIQEQCKINMRNKKVSEAHTHACVPLLEIFFNSFWDWRIVSVLPSMFPLYLSSIEKGARGFLGGHEAGSISSRHLPQHPCAGACWNRQAGGSVARARCSLATLSRQTVLRGAWCLLKQLPGCLNMQLWLVWKSGSGWEPASNVLPPPRFHSLKY